MSENPPVTAASDRGGERPRAYDAVIAAVEEQIAAGQLRVGDRLPGERDLAARLGVSRAAVREALRMLQALGVVRAGVGVGPDGGTALVSMPSESLTLFLRLHVALANFPTDDVIEARVMLERWSVGLAARHATQADLDALAGFLAGMEEPGVSRERFNDLDIAFHLALAEAGGNRLVTDMTTAIRASMKAPILASFHATPAWDELVDGLRAGHRRVHDAVVARDAEAAADAVEEHVRYAYCALSWTN
ncbi:FadR/GntR family transcriptional regulator [Mobilicoccus massiliensis]|uniref:FadR/GntR family transcriptional regulator n=1 Tax=Mobilicoccus massiliensis TaxID=1522310 RepID=UPI00058D0140|nr:FCD domain-containing protein [Mobilicoccus massiliensis]